MNLDQLFDVSAEKRAAMPKSLWLPGTVDTHVHCRPKKTGQMQMIVAECAAEHEAIVDIPNVPGITSIEAIWGRREEIRSCIPPGKDMRVLITPLVNDKTDPEMISNGWDWEFTSAVLTGIKIFWQGVSNDYGNSISCAAAIEPLIKSFKRKWRYRGGPPRVTLHAECLKDYSGKVIPIKDREFWCIENEVSKIVAFNPEGVYVIRHISDYRTLEWIKHMRGLGSNIHGEISPQYLMLIDDDIFMGEDGHAALMCNCVFWPRPKDNVSRQKIRKAALKGVPWLHIGTDYAMHLEDPTQEKGVKINKKGVAVGGLNFLPRVAKSVVIDFYLAHGRPDLIAPMLSGNAAKLYGIALSGKQYEYVQEDWTVPDYSEGGVPGPFGSGYAIKSACFLGGHTMHWKRAA